MAFTAAPENGSRRHAGGRYNPPSGSLAVGAAIPDVAMAKRHAGSLCRCIPCRSKRLAACGGGGCLWHLLTEM